jgi:hypothetical protein
MTRSPVPVYFPRIMNTMKVYRSATYTPIVRLHLLLFFAFVFSCLGVQSFGQVPQDISQTLAQHDRACAQLSFEWHVLYTSVGPPLLPSQQLASLNLSAKRTAKLFNDQADITDPAIRAKNEQSFEQANQYLIKPRNLHFDEDITIARDGAQIALDTVTKWLASSGNPSATVQYKVWFGKDYVIYYGPANDQNSEPQGPIVWTATEDDLLSIPPFVLSELSILPASYVLLCGKNPLQLYHIQDWQLLSNTAERCILTGTTHNEEGTTAIRLELDKAHGDVPATIIVQKQNHTGYIYTVKNWQHQYGIWLPARVHLQYLNPHIAGQTYEDWTLTKVADTANITVDIPLGEMVADCRLLGPNPTTPQLYAATAYTKVPHFDAQHEVFYPWPGSLPTLEQLRGILEHNKQEYEQQRPHRSSLLVPYISLVLGLGLIGSGVWLLRTKWKTKKRA